MTVFIPKLYSKCGNDYENNKGFTLIDLLMNSLVINILILIFGAIKLFNWIFEKYELPNMQSPTQ